MSGVPRPSGTAGDLGTIAQFQLTRHNRNGSAPPIRAEAGRTGDVCESQITTRNFQAVGSHLDGARISAAERAAGNLAAILHRHVVRGNSDSPARASRAWLGRASDPAGVLISPPKVEA